MKSLSAVERKHIEFALWIKHIDPGKWYEFEAHYEK
jgi:hypothetical protein